MRERERCIYTGRPWENLTPSTESPTWDWLGEVNGMQYFWECSVAFHCVDSVVPFFEKQETYPKIYIGFFNPDFLSPSSTVAEIHLASALIEPLSLMTSYDSLNSHLWSIEFNWLNPSNPQDLTIRWLGGSHSEMGGIYIPYIFPIQWGAKELLRVSQPSQNLIVIKW